MVRILRANVVELIQKVMIFARLCLCAELDQPRLGTQPRDVIILLLLTSVDVSF